MCAGIQGLMDKSYQQGEEKGFKQGEEKGFKQGEEKGFKQGEEKGFKQGTENGEDKLGRLVAHLIGLGQNDDIAKVAVDTKYRQKLYLKYGIS